MIKKHHVFRTTSVLMLLVYLQTFVLSGAVFGQDSECSYEPGNPTLDSARKSFLALNYKCAEEELNALLALDTMSIEEKANAHVLLAEVYYAKVRNDSEKRDKVMEQFVAAFNSYREWRGELNIKSPEFMAMMKEAQAQVDQEKADVKAADEKAAHEAAVVAEPPKKEEGKKKAWYTQWWAIALGVGVVAGAVVLAGGGGDDGGTPPATELPDFPPPPAKDAPAGK
ncbi:MAG: hypothetical protein CVT49_00220 [candidate division Zixibacteria bacterium HGW-Zixibacteria-1]|nr:MAG: hypothetical protein CVT49_00220 [candidate division Zixibacteria bacterium HGW-Zixibacteria-1]